MSHIECVKFPNSSTVYKYSIILNVRFVYLWSLFRSRIEASVVDTLVTIFTNLRKINMSNHNSYVMSVILPEDLHSCHSHWETHHTQCRVYTHHRSSPGPQNIWQVPDCTPCSWGGHSDHSHDMTPGSQPHLLGYMTLYPDTLCRWELWLVSTK